MVLLQRFLLLWWLLIGCYRYGPDEVWATSFEPGAAVSRIPGKATFSPDGKKVAIVSGNFYIVLWDLETNTHTSLGNPAHLWDIRELVFSPVGFRLVSVDSVGYAKVWDFQNGRLLFSLGAEGEYFSFIKFNSDGSIIAANVDTWSGKRMLRSTNFYEARTGKLLLSLQGKRYSPEIEFDPSGDYVVVSPDDGPIEVLRVSDGKKMFSLGWLSLRSRLYAMASYDSGGAHILTESYRKKLALWDAKTGKFSLSMRSKQPIYTASISQDGSKLFAVGEDNLAQIWDTKEGRLLFSHQGKSLYRSKTMFSPDGSRLLTQDDPNSAEFWDVATNTPILKIHEATRLDLSFSPEGDKLFLIQQRYIEGRLHPTAPMVPADPTPRVYDTKTGKLLYSLSGHFMDVIDLELSADRACIVTSSLDGTVKVWDASTGTNLFSLRLF
jgi:WD40 repeat protein